MFAENIILFFIGGLIFGSFLNVLLWRLPEGQGIGGRSHCRDCQHQLAWYDLIPVFSFLFLSGKCRYCKARISTRYPLVEIFCGLILSLFLFIRQPELSLGIAVQVFGLLILISLFCFDLLYMILPDVIVLPAIFLYLVYDIYTLPNVEAYILSALLAASFFAILYIVSSGEKLGFGDVKLAVLLGLMFGYPLVFIVVCLGVWLAAAISFVLLLLAKAKRTDAIPLGAFLSLSSIVAIIFYNEIIKFIHFFIW